MDFKDLAKNHVFGMAYKMASLIVYPAKITCHDDEYGQYVKLYYPLREGGCSVQMFGVSDMTIDFSIRRPEHDLQF